MAQPLTDAINALTTYANSVTGASDTTLSEAVATLANGYGGGGGSFDTGTVTGDGTTTSGWTRFNVSKLCTHFIIFWEDPRSSHQNKDLVFAGGTASVYFGTMYTGTGIASYTAGDYSGSYLKFYDSYINVKFAVNGGWCALHDGGTYTWIAW